MLIWLPRGSFVYAAGAQSIWMALLLHRYRLCAAPKWLILSGGFSLLFSRLVYTLCGFHENITITYVWDSQ